MVARRLEAVIAEVHRHVFAWRQVDRLLPHLAAVGPKLDPLARPRLAAEVLQHGLDRQFSVNRSERLDRPQVGDRDVLRVFLSHVNHDQRRRVGQPFSPLVDLGQGRGAVMLRQPAHAAEVAQKIDLRALQAGLLASGVAEHALHFLQCGSQVGRAVRQLEVFDLAEEIAGLEDRSADHRPGRSAGEHQREAVASGTLLDNPRGKLLGLLEAALVGGPVTHREGAVDH